MRRPAPPIDLHSVRTRLTLWNVLVMGLLLLALGATLHYLAQNRLQAALDDQLVDNAQHLMGGPGHPPRYFIRFHGNGGRRDDRWGPIHDHDPGPHLDNGFPAGFGVGVDPAMSDIPPQPDGPDHDHDPGNPNRPAMPHPPRVPSTIAEAREMHTLHRDNASSEDDAAAPIQLMTRFLSTDGWTESPPGENPLAPWDAQAFAQALKGKSGFSTIQVDGEPIRVYTEPRRYRERIIGVVQAAATLTETQQEISRATRNLLTLLPFALIGVAVTGAFLTGRALRPVQEITLAAERIEARNLSGRLTVSGHDEFARLATTFNGMLERLERAFDQQRRFTADASHELRTPLTIIKTNAGLALSAERKTADYKRTLATVEQAADMMTRIVEDLLFLARSEAATPAMQEYEPVLIEDILSIAVGAIRNPSQAPISMDTADSSLRVLGDRYALVRLVTNLLTNALRYTPPEGSIHVFAFAPEDEADTLLIEVTDTGKGIAPEHLPHVFEAFYRADPSRTRSQGGTGLGLPICRAIAEAHGGTITLDSVLNQGTTARIRLPLFV